MRYASEHGQMCSPHPCRFVIPMKVALRALLAPTEVSRMLSSFRMQHLPHMMSLMLIRLLPPPVLLPFPLPFELSTLWGLGDGA